MSMFPNLFARKAPDAGQGNQGGNTNNNPNQGGQGQGTQQGQNNNNGGQGGGQGNNGVQGPGTTPNGGNQNTQNQGPADPMAPWAKMFDNPSTDTDTPPSFSIDPKVMDEVVGKQDFMKGINPELMQKALAGDAQSMMEIMHTASRNAYRTAIEHGGVLTDKFVGAREAHGSKNLGSRVKEELTQHALSDTPNFQNPVVKKQLTQIAKLLSQQHPDASHQEIAKMSRDYLQDLVKVITPEDKSANQQAKGEVNWDNFFDESPSNS
jgi:hypothetical protein